MRITLDAVETLDAIQRTGSFAGAARELHKVQSAVSYSVKSLEDALGLVLFDRSGHRAALTDAGRAVLEEGRLLLERARRMETLAERFRDAWEPRLAVVVDGVLPMDPVLRVLRRLGEEEVPTHVQLTVEYLRGVQDRFERDRADLMLVKDWTPTDGLVARALPEQELVLVVGRDHALGRTRKAPTRVELQRHVELTVHDTSESRRRADAHLFGGARVFYLGDFRTKKEALLMGLGFGWMPMHLVRAELKAGALRELRCETGSRSRFTPMLVHPADRPPGRCGRRFFELLVEARAAS